MTSSTNGSAAPLTSDSRSLGIGSLQEDRARREREARQERVAKERDGDERKLETLLRNLVSIIYRIRDDELHLNAVENEREALDKETPGLGALEAFLYGPLWLSALAVVDMVLIGATIHDVVQASFGADLSLAWILWVPALIATAEVAVSGWLAAARGAARTGEADAVSELRTARSIALCFALGLPALGAASHVIAALEANEASDWLIPAGALFVGLAFHSATLFGGHRILPSLKRTSQFPRRWRLFDDHRRLEQSIRDARAKAPAAVDALKAASARHEIAHGRVPNHCRLDPRDVPLLNHALGREMVVAPAPESRPEAQQVPLGANHVEAPTNTVGPAAEPNGDGEDYLRTILEARLREADGEIRQ